MDDLTRRQLEMERRVYRLEDLVDKELARSNAATMAAEYLGNVLTLEWTYTGRETPACYRIAGPNVTVLPDGGISGNQCQQYPTLLSGSCDEYPEAPYYSSLSVECYNTKLGAWVWICRADWKYPVYKQFPYENEYFCAGQFVWSYSDVVDGAAAGAQGIPAMPAPYAQYRYQVTLAPTRRMGYSVNGIFTGGGDRLYSGIWDGVAASNTIANGTGTFTGVSCYGGIWGDFHTGNITASAGPIKTWPPIALPKGVTVTIVKIAATAAPLTTGQNATNLQANSDAATICNQIGGVLGGYSYTRSTDTTSWAPCFGEYMSGFPFDPSRTVLGAISPTFLGVGRCSIEVSGGVSTVETSRNTQPLIDTSRVFMSGKLSKCLGAITTAEPVARLYIGNPRMNPAFYIGASADVVASCNPSKYPNPDRAVYTTLGGFGGNIPYTSAPEGEPIDKEWTVTVDEVASAVGDKYDNWDPQTGRAYQGVCNLSVTLKVKINCSV